MDTAVTQAPSVAEQTFVPIPINRDHLHAVGLFAADGDIRACLNGVLVHVLAGGDVRLIATNGSALAIAHAPNAEVLPPAATQIIVPIEVVKLFRKGDGIAPLFVFSDDGEAFRLESHDLSVNFTPIAGPFPDYARILPAGVSGETAEFDPELLMLFNRAAKIYAGKARATSVEHNGEGPALVHLPTENFVGVVMPWRNNLPYAGLPAWIKAGRPADPSDDGASLPGIPPTEEPDDDKPVATVGDAERASAAPKRRRKA